MTSPRRSAAFAALATAAALAVAPLAARAQDAAAPDSLPFRAGQWAAEFAAGSGFGGVGVMRFHSARAAWTADLSANGTSDRFSDQSGPSSNSDLAATLRLGHRWYRPLGRATAAYVGGGLTGSLGVNRSERAGFRATTTLQSAGAFGDLGAAWFVTPHLSLGAASSLVVVARQQHASSRSDTVDDAGFRSNGVNGSLGTARLMLGLYF